MTMAILEPLNELSSDCDESTGHHRMLWLSVLEGIVADARGNIVGLELSEEERKNTMERARKFLTTPSSGLTEICVAAGVNPEWALRKLRQQAKRGFRRVYGKHNAEEE